MKKFLLHLLVVIACYLIFVINACETVAEEQDEKEEVNYSAGDPAVYTVGGITFNMIYVPAKTFKTETNDSGSASVNSACWMAETEVTYELWNAVYLWSTDAARGENIYHFENTGTMGDGNGDTNQHPVTTINWRDAMVWCNALTEWYNSFRNSSLGCVYKYSSAVIRDSRDANAALCDAAVQDINARGFRLQTSNEWELAARYINDANNDGDISDSGEYYAGSNVSGDATAYCYPSDGGTSTVFGDYAWYDGNSGSSTHIVKTRTGNALGIYDMCGNAVEYCFNPFAGNPSYRTIKGGGYGWSSIDLRVGASYFAVPDEENIFAGLRFVRNR